MGRLVLILLGLALVFVLVSKQSDRVRSYTQASGEPTEADERVNQHLSTTSDKQRLEKLKTNSTLRNNIQYPIPQGQQAPNPVETMGVPMDDQPNAFSHERPPAQMYKRFDDPGTNVQREVAEDVSDSTELQYQRAQAIETIKKEANKSGYKVRVVPAGQ